MSIKSDKWIRRMSEEHGMIDPFEPNQIKEADGRRIISYGTSSYGYDIRCANEFKIFTNINSTIVDPKNFDPKNFVTVEDDCCIIPPNSFALARTVEFPYPAQCADRVSGQIDLCPLRHYRERNAVRTGVGRLRNAGVFQYHAAARQNLCGRRRGAGAVFRERRSVRNFV